MKINKKAFTLAEILITLSIIAVIAAILFPSILANYNERSLKAKRQALFGRMSQAMGEMADELGNYASQTCANDASLTTCTDTGSALKFISEGLGSKYKIQALCDADTMAACDIPSEITLEDGSIYLLKNAKSIQDYFTQTAISENTIPFNTASAAFMTKNGESVLLFYNPYCSGLSTGSEGYSYSLGLMCVNMIYDLNGGKKKPNKVGEDIGFMTVFYPDAPYVVSPRPYDWKAVPDYFSTTNGTVEYINSENTLTYAEAKAACAALGENISLPNHEEGMSMLINRELWAPMAEQGSPGTGEFMWTSTMLDPSHVWMVEFHARNRLTLINSFTYYIDPSSKHITRCIYKDW